MHYTTSCNTQSSAPEDGRDHRPKHVELIGIINKLLLLQLVGVYIIYVNDVRSNKYQMNKKNELNLQNNDSEGNGCLVRFFSDMKGDKIHVQVTAVIALCGNFESLWNLFVF